MDDSEHVPAGWYPTPDGGNRYWDGERWLSLPDPASQSTTIGHSSGTTIGKGSKHLIVSALIAIGLLVVSGGAALYMKSTHDTAMRNAEIISSSRSSAAAAAAAADQKQKADDAKRAERKQTVKEIEASVKTMAEQHIQDGLFSGPILQVSCDPVGGSTDDLTAQTTIFACFVATEDNGDGTYSGEKYHARMNWDTDDLTYGYGPPS